MEDFEKQLKEIEEQQKALAEKYNEVLAQKKQQKTSKLKEKRRELQDTRIKLQTEMNNLEAKKQDIEVQISNLEKRLSGITEEIDAIDIEIASQEISDVSLDNVLNEKPETVEIPPVPMVSPIAPESVIIEDTSNMDSTKFCNRFAFLDNDDTQELFGLLSRFEYKATSGEEENESIYSLLGNILDSILDRTAKNNNLNINFNGTPETFEKINKVYGLLLDRGVVKESNNVSYECINSSEVNTNAFTFLIMLYATTLVGKENRKASWPAYGQKTIGTCLASLVSITKKYCTKENANG